MPEIEHITQNYVPLKNVLTTISEKCGKELQNLLRTTENLPSNNARKEQFLNFLVAARQLYVKAYVLCKWAVVSKDISKAIDIANWLRGQVNCFNNVVQALFHLQAGLGPVKAVHADINSALEILKTGMPASTPELQPFMPEKKLDDVEVLVVLRQLDTLIAVKLALDDNLPAHYRDYSVLNGRARFNLKDSPFWIELSMAEEDLEAQSRLFYVDFGIDSATLPEAEMAALKARVEAIVNTQLSSSNLETVLDWVARFSCNYMLVLIDKKLRAMQNDAGPWAGVISHTFHPQQGSIEIRFFLKSSSPGSAKITLSPHCPCTLVVLPSPDPTFVLRAQSQVPHLLSLITRQHAVTMLNFRTSWITPVDSTTVSVQLAKMRFVQLYVDTTSGLYILNSSAGSARTAQRRLNSGDEPLAVLNDLRTQSYLEAIAQKAKTAGWTVREVRLAPTELKKIEPANSILAMTLPLSNGWSLCVAVSHDVHTATASVSWLACKLECVQRRWYLNDEQKADLTALGPADPQTAQYDLDYGNLDALKKVYSTRFVLYEFVHDLRRARVDHVVRNGGVIINYTSLSPKSTEWSHSGLMCTAADGYVTIEGRAKLDTLLRFGEMEHVHSGVKILIDGTKGGFRLIPVSRRHQLSDILDALSFLNNSMISFVSISQSSLQLDIVSASLTSVEILYAKPHGALKITEGKVELGASNPQEFLAPFFPNLAGKESNTGTGVNSTEMVDILRFLRAWYPLCEFLQSRAYVVLPQTLYSLRVQRGFADDVPYLELCYKISRGQKMVVLVTAGNGADKIKKVDSAFKIRDVPGMVPLVSGCAVEATETGALMELLKALETRE